ncbi:MAG: RHS repeat-associated core domain-containing protein [Acidobacteriota bacterium]
MVTDRMGSVRMRTNVATAGPDIILQSARLYPFGEELSPATANDRDKFATYYRDNSTGLDYAMNRYYGSTLGRFTTPDPFGGSARLGNPGSWNRYSYVIGDPVNRTDSYGLDYDTGDSPFDPADPRNVGDTSVGVWDTVGGTPVDPAFLAWGPFYTASNTPPSIRFVKESKKAPPSKSEFLEQQRKDFVNKSDFSQDCLDWFRQTFGKSIQEVQEYAKNTMRLEYGVNNPKAYAGTTVGKFMSEKGAVFLAPYEHGNTVYYYSPRIFTDLTYGANFAHEILHKLDKRLTDEFLLRAIGKDPKDLSGQISKRIREKCFQ